MDTALDQADPAKAQPQASLPTKHTVKKKNILEAAHYVISEKGIKAATITGIAKRAGVTDSIIYHYFKNKEDLIFSVLDQQLLTAIEDLKFHFKGIIGPVSKFGKMIWYHLSMNDKGDTQMRKNMLLECRSLRNFTAHKSYNTLLEYIGVMDTILEACVQDGFFKPDLNIPLARTMILGFLDEEGLVCSRPEAPHDTLSDFDHIMDLVLAMTTHLPAADADAERPDKYSRILEAAKHLYAEKGFKKATMLEVASLAGVAEGTIYEYFKNKQDLLLSITKNYFGNLKHNLDNAFAIDHPAEKLRWLMWRHFTIFAGDRELVSVFLKETKLKKYFYEDEANEVFVRYHYKICEVLEEGIEVGVFRPEINTRVFRNLVMGALAACYNRWYFRKPVYALDYMTELHQFIDLICSAATAPPTAAG
jgi:TetR/AcrR family fatty acid metabolism transcriptional regulator